ncbi:MAG: aldehyde dehydrogenase family protein, partial [Acidimicrobiia bacterium]
MSRLAVKKTHKLYIGGKFPRSESGRSYPALDAAGDVVARVAWASRKDLRDAVRSARSAQPGWAGLTASNRGQVMYRIAEMIEDRAATFAEQVAFSGAGLAEAEAEVAAAIDSTVWYAGWADKFAQIHGNLNPVAGPFFNISAPEPSGVIGVVAPALPSLLGLLHRVLPVVVSGNTAVVVASETWPVPAVSLTEVLATSDVPGG